MSHATQNGWDFFLAKGKTDVGVVVIHEIFGYSPYVEDVATELAKGGFSAASIDLFRGAKADTLEAGMKLRESVTKEALREGLSAGAELLRGRSGARMVGSMGFCMGGGFALQAACDLGLDFCVDFYGQISDAEDVSKLKGPVLLVLGSEDARVTPWAFQQFLPAAMKHNKRVETQLYPNAKHAFHRPGWEGHNPAAAKDAWDKTLRFMSQFGRA
ncbi:MAG: dienelactone hydrolase family protein [Nitrososphaerota archaeon]|jgi:carboxymethylenebutenolidase|nr:dienelactone hydrolase family protein [Nitrososphaerota archaeon]